MHVLERVHRWLRPGGRLLDLHPEPEPAAVDVVSPTGVTPVGPFERPTLDEKIHAARGILAGLVEKGLFRPERTARFEVIDHHAGVDAWLEYRARRNASNVVNPALLDRARKMMRSLGGHELLVREQLRATRYRRGGTGG